MPKEQSEESQQLYFLFQQGPGSIKDGVRKLKEGENGWDHKEKITAFPYCTNEVT